MITNNQIRDLRADLTVLLAANFMLPYYFPESALGDFGFGLLADVFEDLVADGVFEFIAALGACSILLTAPIATVSFWPGAVSNSTRSSLTETIFPKIPLVSITDAPFTTSERSFSAAFFRLRPDMKIQTPKKVRARKKNKVSDMRA
jgi:hypothetical protein